MNDQPAEGVDFGETTQGLTQASSLGPTSPDEPVSPRGEIEQLILKHEGRLGDVYIREQRGMSPVEIANDLDVATPGFVWAYRAQANAALDGKPVGGSSSGAQVITALNGLLRRGRGELSAEALDLLKRNKAAVEAYGHDDSDAEVAKEVEDTAETIADLEGISGIYAFSYGWYLESRIDSDHGSTLVKVGKAQNIAERMRNYVAGVRTHIPEPLVLLRVYEVSLTDLSGTESTFHELLDAAGHENPRRLRVRRSEVGKEWFMTSEDFLDVVAKALKLRTRYIGSQPLDM